MLCSNKSHFDGREGVSSITSVGDKSIPQIFKLNYESSFAFSNGLSEKEFSDSFFI